MTLIGMFTWKGQMIFVIKFKFLSDQSKRLTGHFADDYIIYIGFGEWGFVVTSLKSFLGKIFSRVREVIVGDAFVVAKWAHRLMEKLSSFSVSLPR
jgi:hypothetical protein